MKVNEITEHDHLEHRKKNFAHSWGSRGAKSPLIVRGESLGA